MKRKALKKYSVDYLLNEYRENNRNLKKSIKFINPFKDKDIYNITSPFIFENEKYLIGRVEPRDSEFSEILFFKIEGNHLIPQEGISYKLQDPFFTYLNNEFILGGVEIWEESEKINWRTVFYKGDNFKKLKKFFTGPSGMKDIRLFEMQDKIGIFTRPQGEKGGRGKIGFTYVENLDDLSINLINNAPLINDFLLNDEWGGVNAVYPYYEKHKFLVLGHIAKFSDDGNRHYYPMTFIFDSIKKEATNIKIIAERQDLPEGESKRKDLYDVMFSGGLYFENNETFLYAGVSDCEAWYIKIE